MDKVNIEINVIIKDQFLLRFLQEMKEILVFYDVIRVKLQDLYM